MLENTLYEPALRMPAMTVQQIVDQIDKQIRDTDNKMGLLECLHDMQIPEEAKSRAKDLLAMRKETWLKAKMICCGQEVKL
jgi:hypothetical protein